MNNQIENQVEVQPQNKKNGKGKTFAIIILVILLLGAVGYIAYDKVFNKETKEAQNAEKKVKEQPKLLTNDEAIRIGQDLYLKTRDLYVGGINKLMNKEYGNWLENSSDEYLLENGVATKITDTSVTNGCGFYQYPSEVSIAIKNLFTTSGLDKFLDNEWKYNKRWVAKDNNDNFYMIGCLSRSGTTELDEITIKPTNIEEDSITFIVTDYRFEAGLEDSEYNINSTKATKLDNTFKIVKENDNWKVEDYTDSYSKFLEQFN